jgi:acyl carrier protein
MNQGLESENRSWSREEIDRTFRAILVDALGVDDDKIVPEASLVYDLGAESIDFLDIGFRVQQTFGVEIPSKAIQAKVFSWRNLGELRRILEQRYALQVSPEEMKQFQAKGISEVLQWLADKQRVPLHNGEAKKVAAELADRLVDEVESMGFRASLIDRDDVIHMLQENLNSPKIAEAMLRLFSVGAMVDFIASKVGDAAINR